MHTVPVYWYKTGKYQSNWYWIVCSMLKHKNAKKETSSVQTFFRPISWVFPKQTPSWCFSVYREKRAFAARWCKLPSECWGAPCESKVKKNLLSLLTFSVIDQFYAVVINLDLCWFCHREYKMTVSPQRSGLEMTIKSLFCTLVQLSDNRNRKICKWG